MESNRHSDRLHAPRILALGLVISLAGVPAASVGEEREPMRVVISSAVQQTVASGRTFVGTTKPKRASQIGSTAADRVVDFPINEGDRVEEGATLAKLDTRTLEIQLAAAQAELENRQQQLTELENGTRPEEIREARANVDSAKATLAYAKTRLDRYERLYESDRAAYDEYRQAVSAHDRAAAELEAAKAALDLAVEGPRKERIAQAKALLHVQREEVNRIKDDIAKHTIAAPFTGYVVAEHTEVGQWLGSGGAVVDLIDLSEVDVEIPVLEDYIRHVHLGTQASVSFGALPGQVFDARVVHIVPQADERSRCFPVKVRLKNRENERGPMLRSGMFARVTLSVGEPTTATLVPKDALVLGGPSPVVYVVDLQGDSNEAGVVRPAPVELGVTQGSLIEVKGPIRPGERVVVRGNERLRPGLPVKIISTVKPSATQPVAGAKQPASPAEKPAR